MTRSQFSFFPSATPFSTVEISGSPATEKVTAPTPASRSDASNFSADHMIMGQRLDAAAIHVTATPQGFQFKNDVKVGGAPATLEYHQGRGDTTARDQMVRANLRLVVNIARGYTGKGLNLQDLIEEGNLGLLRAVEGFDPTMNTRFSTYASYWIKQSIKRALVNTAKTIRIPAYMVELLAKWRRATNKLQDELEKLVGDQAIRMIATRLDQLPEDHPQ